MPFQRQAIGGVGDLSTDWPSRPISGPPHKTLPCPPFIHAARFPQEKIFKDKLPFASNKRLVADPARYFPIDGLRARWSFDNLIQSKAAFAVEKRNCIRVRHVSNIPAIASARRKLW